MCNPRVAWTWDLPVTDLSVKEATRLELRIVGGIETMQDKEIERATESKKDVRRLL